MRLTIAAVGKLKDAAEREICERYTKRFNGAGRSLGLGPLEVVELSEAPWQFRRCEKERRSSATTEDSHRNPRGSSPSMSRART